MGQRRVIYRVWWGNMRERDYLEETDVAGKIILRLIYRKCDMGAWTGSIWLRIVADGGHL